MSSGKKILIVEDEVALRDIYVMLFKSQQFDVHDAANGKVAMDRLHDVQPDAIVLDILMPVMSGIEFLEAVDIKKKYPDTRVLVLSNLSDSKTITQVKKLGADKYLLKASASPKELISTVNELLES
jgi:DNA-binding response OmpR family regulator